MARPVLGAILGLSCAAGSALAAAAPCGRGGACAAEDGLSALQTVGRGKASALALDRKAAAHTNSTGRPRKMRGAPFLGPNDRAGPLDGHVAGALYIEEDGVKRKYYLPGATVEDDGMTVKYSPPYRFYLMKEPTTDYSDASKFYKPQLVGKTFTVDMKLQDVGCGCNVNFYLVDMPAKKPGLDQDHYCDAQCFEGLGCCSEFDMCEGNSEVQQITNHACTKDYDGHPDWQCHQWGEPEAKMSPSEFASHGRGGVGGAIDGNKPFTFSQSFRMQGEELTVVTTISQGDAKVVKTMGPNPQLQAMLQHGSLLKGMAFVTGYWTDSDMNWLDGESCGDGPELCSGAPAYISNWRITTNPPEPEPKAPEPKEPEPKEPESKEPESKEPEADEPEAEPEFLCCYGSIASCKPRGDWCSEKAEHCTGSCMGRWSKVQNKCCYGGGQNCKEEGNWCNQRAAHCEGTCRGEWTKVLG